jgi:predicted transcriptional regulator
MGKTWATTQAAPFETTKLNGRERERTAMGVQASQKILDRHFVSGSSIDRGLAQAEPGELSKRNTCFNSEARREKIVKAKRKLYLPKSNFVLHKDLELGSWSNSAQINNAANSLKYYTK